MRGIHNYGSQMAPRTVLLGTFCSYLCDINVFIFNCKCILNDFGLFVCLYLTCKFIVVSMVKNVWKITKNVEFNVGLNSIRIHSNQVCGW